VEDRRRLNTLLHALGQPTVIYPSADEVHTMTRTILGTVLAFLACCEAHGQAADPPLAFEVASIKPAPLPTGPGGRLTGCFRGTGPGSADASLYTCSNATVSLMAFQAYGLKSYQIGPGYYADTAAFNVLAKVPPEATAEQVKLMLRTLLAERFKLAFHYEKKEMPVYDLVVAKGGLKMKESLPESAGAAPPAYVPENKMEQDADGFPMFTAPRGMRMLRANGLGRIVAGNAPMAALANFLTNNVGRPVTDSTGLTAKYDFTVTFTLESLVGGTAMGATDSAGGLTIFAALEKQLGLKLEPTKTMVDIFVIDHAEKSPIEN
jgi:uncharacterized protein (TIGR03435 family)